MVAKDLIIPVNADASELLAALSTLYMHAEESPDILECFNARFPTLSDVADSEVESDGKEMCVTLRPSEAFRSFIQDLA